MVANGVTAVTPFIYWVQFPTNFEFSIMESRGNSDYERKLSCKSIRLWFIKRWIVGISDKEFYFSSFLKSCQNNPKFRWSEKGRLITQNQSVYGCGPLLANFY